MATAQRKLPLGWRVEVLGLIGAVQFTHQGDTRMLLWCDGAWTIGRSGYPAPGVPAARNTAEARTIGTAFIWSLEDERDS